MEKIDKNIQNLKKTYISLNELEQLVEPSNYMELVEKINQLISDGIIRPIKNKRNTNGKIPSLFVKYRIIKNQEVFTRVEENIRNNKSNKKIDLKHYKFFFNSVTDNSEKYILLDIAFEKNEYPKIIEKKIENYKLKVSSNIKVKIPSIESILGDKLTTLATKTIGISYNSGKELELMKQL